MVVSSSFVPFILLTEIQRKRNSSRLLKMVSALFLLLLLLLSSSLFVASYAQQTSSNMTLGSSLSTSFSNGGNSFLVSESGQFAFGFYRKASGFAVGIWVQNIKQKTVVWTANRDDPPLLDDVKVILTDDGKLVLQQMDARKKLIMDSPEPVFMASILNSGNFVLYDVDSNIIWQSFDRPTETILPGQRLRSGQNLVSSVSNSDQTSGKFRLSMQIDGNLVLYPFDAEGSQEYAYWYTGTYNAGPDVSLNLDSNGQLYLLNSTKSNIKNINDGNNLSDYKNYLYRAAIDPGGILTVYSHSTKQDDDWSINWVSSTNGCDSMGLCALNAFCTLAGQETFCRCLPEFVYVDENDKELGCRRNYSDGCERNNGQVYSTEELIGVTWENNPFSTISSISQTDCADECLKDCNCEVAFYENQKCKMQKLPLRYGNGNKHQEVLSITIVKTGRRKVDEVKLAVGGGRRRLQLSILISSLAIFAVSVAVFTATGFLLRRRLFWKQVKISDNEEEGFVEDVTLRSYSYSELEAASNGFRDEVGRGAFGTVFRGEIVVSNSSRKTVAIKRLEKVVMAENERDFRNEMKTIGKTHHKNLVKLLGFCNDGTNRLLVYEFMSNGSLADFLFTGERKPDWEERIRTAIDIARGILYLHEECDTQIIHCDIKPENILMDENKRAKLADFGLAKLLNSNQTRTYTGVRGTRGYVAPEWHRNLPITVKADVYSYGVMLMEMICCRKKLDTNLPPEDIILENLVFDCFADNQLEKLVRGQDDVDKNQLERMVKVGLWCIQEEPSIRPSIKKVVLMLEGTVDIPSPPFPSSFLTSIQT